MPDRPYYSVQQLRDKVIEAAAIFLWRDSLLLSFTAHEQAIAHRIANYLEFQFKDDETLNLDCEYNKHLKKPKRICLDVGDLLQQKQEAGSCWCSACEKVVKEADLEELDDKLFRPDIVAHSRGNDDRNLIAIEIKTHRFCPFDAAKLKAMTISRQHGGDFGYQLGAFVFFSDGKASFKWYSDGALIPE